MKKNKIQILRFLVQLVFMIGMILAFTPNYNMVGKKIFLTILIVGVFFCGWVCPFGAIQDWLSVVGRKLKLPQYQVPEKIQNYLQLLRYVLYALGVVGISYAVINARASFNHKLFTNTLTLWAGVFLGIFLVLSLFIKRPFCNYFCTKGASYGLLSVLRIFGISRDNDTCIHCHLCDKNCPMNIKIEKETFIRHPNCINCLTCVGVCPKKCIKYKLKK